MEQIILDGIQRGLENGKWRTYKDIMPSITAREFKEPRSVMEVIQIGNIAEEKNFSNPQTGRIYDVGGCSTTLSTMQGGNREPKVIVENQIPCKLDKMPDGHLDSLDNAQICDVDTPTASTVTSRYYKGIGAHKDNMCIVAMRGRNPDNPSDRSVGSPTEQRLEPNMSGTSDCLTSAQKDNLVLEPKYRIRKLTPRECGRLMGVSDEDISKMAAVNSNTQLYKQFGNSIVVDVMCAMFRNLNINQ